MSHLLVHLQVSICAAAILCASNHCLLMEVNTHMQNGNQTPNNFGIDTIGHYGKCMSVEITLKVL